MHVCPCCGQEIAAVGLKLSPSLGRVSSALGEARLSPVRMALVTKLLHHAPDPVSSERLARYAYGIHSKHADVKGSIRRNVHELRKDLAPLGYTVISLGWVGYALRPLQRGSSPALESNGHAHPV